jgi:hypothetical protein
VLLSSVQSPPPPMFCKNKTARQVTLAGEASEAVLHLAADSFAGKVEVRRLADGLMDASLDVGFSVRDQAHISMVS